MNLDDQLRQRLQSSYSMWEPQAPADLPAPRRSHTPLIAGATVSTVSAVGLVAAVVLAGGSPAHRSPAGAQSLETAVRPCTVDDARLVVTTDKPSYVQQPADEAHRIEDRMVTLHGSLVATSATPCRLYEESMDLVLHGPGGAEESLLNSCLSFEHRHNRTGPTPAPITDGPWCAENDAEQASRPSPTESPTDPGEYDDYGVLFVADAPDAGGAHQSQAADAEEGKLTPEPTFGSQPFGSVGSTNVYAVGQWTATYTYGPWSGSATFAVTPAG